MIGSLPMKWLTVSYSQPSLAMVFIISDFSIGRTNLNKKRGTLLRLLDLCQTKKLFLIVFLVSAVELIYTSGCIYKLHLTSKEWVRRAGDLYLYQRVGLAVYINCLFGCLTTSCDKHLIIRHIR